MCLQESRARIVEWLVQPMNMGATAGLHFDDLRHYAMTEPAKSFVSDQTIMSIAGRVSRRMLEH
jgi:hypothetical protein